MSNQNRGCLANLFGGFLAGGAKQETESLPKIMVSTKFMTSAEVNFYRVLHTVVRDKGVIFAQVSMNQLLFLPGSDKINPGRTKWNNKIARRAVDFVVCDPKTLRPLVAIELDDSTHASAKREQRDDEVEQVMEAAGLPFVHVLASRQYDTRELSTTIGEYLNGLKPSSG